MEEYKIYSRKRLKIAKFNNGHKNNRFKRKLKKMSPIFMITIIAFITTFTIWNSLDPVFNAICEEEAKSIATVVTNEEATKVMNKYNYDTFFTIEKDEKENVKLITANVLKINNVTSDIGLNIQKALNESERTKSSVPIGSMTGIKIFSGMGPEIPIRIAIAGNVETDLKSEFIAQGVNQTIHRVYLEISCTVNILTAFSSSQKNIKNQVLFMENVILGEIPSSYYNFDDVKNKDNTAIEMVK